MNIYIILTLIIFWIISFIGVFYYLYKYYLRNNLAYDFWNFFSKQMTFGKVAFQILINRKNSHQRESKILTLLYVINILVLFLMIWSIAIYQE
ncbi:hypothetical protein EC844_1404 [Acinetobacter calcoaceticus]|uniref:Uncharacterized protein n=1 Tax=Acinetobacter calcoaceticus TaxID=471 RepID=A0A4R1XDX9_ACICA|nr:hypothetical protein EC844_1404 [Acinetobacter calcoaceticus]